MKYPIKKSMMSILAAYLDYALRSRFEFSRSKLSECEKASCEKCVELEVDRVRVLDASNSSRREEFEWFGSWSGRCCTVVVVVSVRVCFKRDRRQTTDPKIRNLPAAQVALLVVLKFEGEVVLEMDVRSQEHLWSRRRRPLES